MYITFRGAIRQTFKFMPDLTIALTEAFCKCFHKLSTYLYREQVLESRSSMLGKVCNVTCLGGRTSPQTTTTNRLNLLQRLLCRVSDQPHYMSSQDSGQHLVVLIDRQCIRFHIRMSRERQPDTVNTWKRVFNPVHVCGRPSFKLNP